MRELATAFFNLFKGLERAHGAYVIKPNAPHEAGKKIVGKATTLKEDVSLELWEDHLLGRDGLGIVPIRDDNTCYFGAIDIDIYEGLSYKVVIDKIREFKLPLIPCVSKSGGLHLYVFLSENIPAVTLQRKLKEFAAVLGYGGVEVFPKQTEILADRGDIGQWINMPYFEIGSNKRAALNDNAEPIKVEEFLELAESTRISIEALCAISTLSLDLNDGPPCLQCLIAKGFEEGTRNDGLFNLGVYLRKAYPDTWQTKIEEFNGKYFKPQLSMEEVQTVIKSLKRKSYFYSCTKPPISNHCNAELCWTRKHGVGQDEKPLGLTSLSKYATEPPIWFVNIEGGGRLELSTDELQNQTKFQKSVMEQLNTMPPIVKGHIWRKMIQKLFEQVQIIEAPKDISAEGQLENYLERFCTSRSAARDKDEILMGKPWTDGGKHHFRISDFLMFLERNHYRDLPRNRISSHLKEMGSGHTFLRLKGKGVNLWTIPEFETQKEKFDLTELKEEF